MLITKSDFQRELFTGGVDTEGGGERLFTVFMVVKGNVSFFSLVLRHTKPV